MSDSAKDIPHSAPEVEQAKEAVIHEYENRTFPPMPADEEFLSRLNHLIAACDARIEMEREEARLHTRVAFDELENAKREIAQLEQRLALLSRASQPSVAVEPKCHHLRDGVMLECTLDELLGDAARFQIQSDTASWYVCELARAIRSLQAQIAAVSTDASRELQPIPSEWGEAANAARGLCESEARKWETQSPKTAEHWHRVAVHLGALYLTQDHLARADASREKDEKELGAGLDVGESTESGQEMRDVQRGDHH